MKKNLSDNTIEFFITTRKLIDHCMCMQNATAYKKEFNYKYYAIELQNIVKEMGSEEDVKKIYPT